MEDYTCVEQMESILDMAASVDLLSHELDKISLHSSAESVGAHSSSKCYDSAFDSHYSEDSYSSNSQTAGPVEMQSSIPHSRYRNTEISQARGIQERDYSGLNVAIGIDKSLLDAHNVIKERSLQNPSKKNVFYTEGRSTMTGFPMRTTTQTTPEQRGKSSSNTTRSSCTTREREFQNFHQHKNSRSVATMELSSHHKSQKTVQRDKSVRTSAVLEMSTSLVSPLQAEVLHMSSHEPVQPLTPAELKPNPLAESYSPPIRYNLPQSEEDSKHLESGSSGSSTPLLQSSISSVDIGEFSSGNCTPTHTDRSNFPFKSDSFHDQEKNSTSVRTSHSFHTSENFISPKKESPTVQRPLTPRVTVISPGQMSDDTIGDITRSPRQPRIPKKGTIFYQDSLSPPKSPHLRALRERKIEEISKHDRTTSSTPLERKNIPRRNPSILKRLIIRKRGSFKQDGIEKKRLPVKRSLSSRITYHIRKGWVDYEEDLNFISQPSQARAMGRMVDKKAGKYHMVQLYRPPSGKYGIYISETPGRRGVFISRFADQHAAKFYSGLISPGDQIIRVNGINVSEENSVDDVYDLMTASDSVIFTVIPISMRSDWSCFSSC